MILFPVHIRLLKTAPRNLNVFDGFTYLAFRALERNGLVTIVGRRVALTEAGKKAIADNQPS